MSLKQRHILGKWRRPHSATGSRVRVHTTSVIGSGSAQSELIAEAVLSSYN